MPTEPLQALPEAERRRRQRDWGLLAGGALALVAAFWVRERIARLPDALPFADSVLFLAINVASIVLIVLLVYLIGRQFVKLVFERRRGVLGSHLNLKFTAALFLVATVPTLALYTVSSTFIQGSFESWFTLQMDRAVEQSREVADAYYTAQASDALHFGAQISEQITDERMLREGNRTELEAFIKARQREYNLGVVQVFPFAEEEPLATLINPDIPSAAFVKRDSTIVASAFKGERVSIVESTGTEIGDIIRGAVPIFSSDPVRPGEVVGALVVNHLVPHPLVQRLTNIRAARDEYSFFKSLSGEIAGVYQLVLLLFALVFVLLAIWWGLRMARAVTGPINALAEGTERVARGDLSVVVQEQSNDEIGMLVRSFNQMTHDLQQALTGLEESNTELEQRRRYMEIVLRNVDAGVASVDAEGRIGTINPSALRLLGIAPGTPVVGSKLAEVLDSPELLDVLRDLGGQTRAGIRESVRQQVLLPKGDEALTLVITLSLLQDEEGRALGSVIVFDDYTQEVRAQRMAAWREVARRIAHEIKNPLTPIQLSAQRIRRRFRGRISDGEDAQVFDEAIDTIMSHVEGLKVLVNEFSQFARLPAANPKPDDLNQLVQEAVSSYAGTERVRFEADLDETLPSVEFDREQIRRVLTNLLDNASAACAETGGEVVVRTLHDSPLQTARVEVTDDGVGIPEEERRRIFEPYYSTKPHGTGLGLAIVSRIVADHHGYIRVHPNRPSGTRFILELPIKVT